MVALFHPVRVYNRAVILSLVEHIVYLFYLTVLMYLVAKHIFVSSVYILFECVNVENVVVISAVYV